MNNIITRFKDFCKEGFLFSDKKIVSIEYTVNADEHFYDRLSRNNNEPDKYGKIIILPLEVEDDIKKAMGKIIVRNLFNNGIYWNKNILNVDLCITNVETNLNTIIYVEKVGLKYLITVKTVMRKPNYQISNKDRNTLKIDI